MLLSAFFGCKKKEEAPADETTAANDTVVTTEPEDTTPQGHVDKFEVPEINYGGKTFFIAARNYGEYQEDLAAHIEELDAKTTSIDRATFLRNKKVSEEFGVNFEFVLDTDENLISAVNNVSTSGDLFCHLYVNHGRYVFGHVINNLAADWNTMTHVNLDNSWWTQSVKTNWATPNGKIFAVMGDLSYMSVGNMGGIFYNKTMFKNAVGLKTPYDHIKEGTWTYANFKKTIMDLDATLDGDGSGDIATDKFAYGTQQWRGPQVIIPSTGKNYLELNKAIGKYTIGIDDERVEGAVSDYIKLLQDPVTYYTTRGISVNGDLRDAFADGRIGMMEDNLKCAAEFAGDGVNFGIVPNYKYDDLVDGYPACIGSGTNTFMVLNAATQEQRDMISVICEAMAYYGQKDVISVYYDTILKYQAMRDAKDLEMLIAIHDSAVVQLIDYAAFGKLGDIVMLVKNGEHSSFTTALDALVGPTMMDLDKWYALDLQ